MHTHSNMSLVIIGGFVSSDLEVFTDDEPQPQQLCSNSALQWSMH